MPSPTSATNAGSAARTEAELIAELEAGERRVVVGDAIEGAVPGAAVGVVGVEVDEGEAGERRGEVGRGQDVVQHLRLAVEDVGVALGLRQGERQLAQRRGR